MAGEITDALIEELGARMEDPDEIKFTSILKVKALNDGQLKVSQLLNKRYLSILEETTAALNMTATTLAFTGLTYEPLNGGEGIITVQDAANDWLTPVSVKELRKHYNSLLRAGATNKVYWIFEEKIWLSVGGGATDAIVVYYMREPSTMAAGATDPILDAALYDVILKFAEASLWTADKQLLRRQAAWDEAMEYIDYLNELAVRLKPLGVGTAESKRR